MRPIGTALLIAVASPAAAQQAMPGMDHEDMPGMDHDSPPRPPAPPAGATGTDLPAGTAPPPAPPTDRWADRSYPAAANARAHDAMMREEGGRVFYRALVNLAEYQARAGCDGYRWDGEAWIGGDVNRLALRTEGEGARGGSVDTAEVQALFAHAIDPYFAVQGGVRQDVGTSARRTFATVAVEGLAPYMFQTEARLFVATNGDVRARLEAWYDQRLTQRLVLQPRAELNFAAQDDRRARIGAGLSEAELGLRLRYEIRREFAPYLGLAYETRSGRSRTLARAAGDDPESTSFVAGVRFWF